MIERVKDWLERRWVVGTMLIWMIFTTIITATNMVALATLNLRDTDDNMRLQQVRDWLGGQDWYDLRQYRMLAPEGADIHWSRLVDLPLAGLIRLTEPMMGTAMAERFATTVVPLAALLVALLAMALVARRTVGRLAWLPAIVAFIFSGVLIGMFTPLRIDHHGWQLACLAWVLAGATDPARRRGGAIMGIAAALSLVIGLEMLVLLALVGAGVVVGWIVRAQEAPRLGMFGITLALGCCVGFLAFASEANRLMRCDALTPVWLADMVLAGAAALLLAWRSPATWQRRLVLAAIAGAVLAAFHALAFPQCLSRLEGVSPEVSEMWLERVTEARGVHTHSLRIRFLTLLPLLVGLVGYGFAFRLGPKDFEHRRRLLLLAVPALVAASLVFWQVRAATAAQLMMVPGAAALIVLLAPRALASGSALVRILGTYFAVTLGLGVLAPLVVEQLPRNQKETQEDEIKEAQAADAGGEQAVLYCKEERVLRQLNRLPRSTLFAHIDMAPRLLVTTKHDTIIGPYHRNDEAIGHVLSVLESPPSEDAEAERTVRAYGADYVFICKEEGAAPKAGAWQLSRRLERGDPPDWLEEVEADWLDPLPIRLFAVR